MSKPQAEIVKETLNRIESNVNKLVALTKEKQEKALSRSVKEYYKGRLDAYDQMLLMIHMLE